MKLWNKSSALNQIIESFTVGSDREIDLHLAKYDVIGSIAHAKMLGHVNLISEEECINLVSELNNILENIESGSFSIPANFEDIHSRIEFLLTEKLGEAGKKIHTARSRNDQSILDIKLYIRHELKEISALCNELSRTLLSLAVKHECDLLPGYTHFQLAMPSSFGLWFSAYAESLQDDLELVKAAYAIADKNPLGSAAGYGSSFPIDREFTTMELGFSSMNVSSVYAQMTRGKTEKACVTAIASIGTTLNKLAADITLYMNQEFAYVSFPDAFTTGSSIMPHKKNPDVWELVRAKSNKLQSAPNELALLLTNLPSGYHRDFQLTKEILIRCVIDIKEMLQIAQLTISEIIIRKNILNDPEYNLLYTVDAVNELMKSGTPFRDAYHNVSEAVKTKTFVKPEFIRHSHAGSIGNSGIENIIANNGKTL